MGMAGTQWFGLGLVLLGIYFLFHNRRSRAQLETSSRWPSVPGRIQSSEVKREGASSKKVYRARVKYTYEVAGTTYKSRAITLGGQLHKGRQLAEERVARYPEGSTHPVYYDPRSPKTACLERAYEGGWLELAGAAFGILLGGALLLGFLPAG